MDDAEWLTELAKFAGVEVELERFEGQQHAHDLSDGWTCPEADLTVQILDSSWMPSFKCYLLSTLSFKLVFCFVDRWGYCLNTVIVPTSLRSVDVWK